MGLLRFRRNTKAAADTSNPVLAAGEPGFATDTGDFRIGDGVSAWGALPDEYRVLSVAAGNSTFARPYAGPKYPLSIPTPDGNPNVTHPSVVAFESPWNGYRYWMAYTPFPDDPRENPCIVASHDKVTWVVPTGGTNPVTPLASITSLGFTYNSDTELVYDASLDALVLFERLVKSSAPQQQVIRRRISIDGITWGAPTDVLSSAAVTYNTILSPSVVIEADGTYTMWAVNNTVAKGSEVERRTSADGVTWGAATTCTIPTSTANGEQDPWHLHVVRTGDRYHMLMSTVNRSLLYWTSLDGMTWKVAGPIPLRTGDAEDAGGFYRSCLVPRPGDPIRFDVFAGIISREDPAVENNNNWRIALIEDVDLTAGTRQGRGVIAHLTAAQFVAGMNSPTIAQVNSRAPAWVMADAGVEKSITTTVSLRGYQRVRVKVVWANMSAATGSPLLVLQTHQFDLSVPESVGSNINAATFLTPTALAQNVINVTDFGEIPIRPGSQGVGVDLVNVRVHRQAQFSLDTLAGDIGIIAVILEQP